MNRGPRFLLLKRCYQKKEHLKHFHYYFEYDKLLHNQDRFECGVVVLHWTQSNEDGLHISLPFFLLK